MKFDLFLKKELKQAINNRKESKTFKNFDSIDTILLLFNKEDLDEVKKIMSMLKKEKKNVIAWTVRPKMSNDEFEEKRSKKHPSNIYFINLNTDLTWKGTLKSDVVDEFDRLEYDACFDLTTYSDLYLLYLLARNSSEFSVGTKESDNKLYDFILLMKEGASLLDTYNQIKYYLDKVK